jgi:hypothetical protein
VRDDDDDEEEEKKWAECDTVVIQCALHPLICPSFKLIPQVHMICCLIRRGSAGTRLLILWVQIPLEA